MALRKKKPANAQRMLTLPYERAAGFRVGAVDGATIVTKADGLGVTFQLNFTRLELSPVAETFELAEGEGLRQSGPPSFESPPRKVIEFAALLRPDHAFQIAMALLQNLAKLPVEMRNRYRLPEIQEAPPLSAAQPLELARSQGKKKERDRERP